VEDVRCEHFKRYVLIASMDVTPEAEPLFNEVYDTEHVPNLLQVPGVRSVTRMKGEPARFAIAGGVRELPAPSPIYTACGGLRHGIDRGDAFPSSTIYDGAFTSSMRSTIRRSCTACSGPKPSSADAGRAKCARTLRTGSICCSRFSKPRGALGIEKDDVPLVRSRGRTAFRLTAGMSH
jgi:hypothetical protein